MTAMFLEIRVQALQNQSWMKSFEDIEIVPLGSGKHLLRAYVVDQPALHGMLNRVHDEQLLLVSMHMFSDDQNAEGNS